MASETVVWVTIKGPEEGSEKEIQLGEFHEVWSKPVSVGSDPGCTVVLASSRVASVAVRVLARSCHKFVAPVPEGTTLPLPAHFCRLVPEDCRVDHLPFQVGPYTITFSEA
jgi:hypothetical protein